LSLKYLLDTSVLSARMRPHPERMIVENLRRHEQEAATAAPVLHELRFGCLLLPHSRKRSDLEAYLAELVLPLLMVLPYDASAAEWHAVERARLARAGRPPAFVDGQIAAIAKVNDLELVTLNVKNFLAFDGLKVTDWL
jgi:tRNA(fMet)-specific endonuclease VapC